MPSNSREVLPDECPVCEHEGLELDRDRSRLDRLPQVANLQCPRCCYDFDVIAHTEAEDPESDGQFWRADAALCRVCSHLWASVFPLGTDESSLECPNCGGATGEVSGDLEDEEE